MSKFVRADFVRGAADALQKQNFPAVYKNANSALALGATPAAYYLCAYHHHQIHAMTSVGATSGIATEITNFFVMYQLSEHFKLRGYAEFTHTYQGLFSKSQEPIKKAVMGMVPSYKHYLQAAQMKYSEGTAVDIRTAENLSGTMEKSVIQQAMQLAQSLELSAPPPSHDYHHHPEPHSPLMGEHNEHKSKCWDKCVIL